MSTKRVRIAMVINENGVWSSMGYSSKDGSPVPDDTLADYACDCLAEGGGNMIVHFIEADIPIPEKTVIQGKIA